MSKEELGFKDLMDEIQKLRQELRTEYNSRFEKVEGDIGGIKSFIDRVLGYTAAISFVITLSFSLLWKKVVGD